MKNFNTNTENKDEWLTPPEIIKALGLFDLDPCAPIVRPWDMAEHHYTIQDDGLSQIWHGRVWLNPPYGRETFKWLERLATHEEGGIALIFARTETRGFHEQIWGKAHSVFFFRGRISFLLCEWEKREHGKRAVMPCFVYRKRYYSDCRKRFMWQAHTTEGTNMKEAVLAMTSDYAMSYMYCPMCRSACAGAV